MSEPVVVLICIAIVVGCFTIALGVTLAAYKIADWARGVRYSRACGHAKDAVAKTDAADPVWGNLAEHDEAFDAALRDEFPDPAATDDVRSAWMQAPVRAATGGRPPWDSQQFPAVQTVTLPAPEQFATAQEHEVASSPSRGKTSQKSRVDGRAGMPRRTHATDFPDGADMPAAGERLAVAVSRGDGEPSNLPGPVPSVDMTMPSGNANAPAGEPVLEGRIVLAPVLGYIDGLALTSTYYERIEQIGVQARVLALAAAA